MEFEILVRGVYRPKQVVITYDPALRMPVDDAIQGWMDDLWQQKLAIAREKGVRLFDAPLFRLLSAAWIWGSCQIRSRRCVGRYARRREYRRAIFEGSFVSGLCMTWHCRTGSYAFSPN